MDVSLLFEYGWVLLVLVALEGILAADNAVVMAIMVKHLPQDQQKKALFYGLAGAFILRFAALFVISYLVNIWQIQAIGALYLIFIAVHHFLHKKKDGTHKEHAKKSGFWGTVLKVELADLAFAIDSILAAVALAVTLPETNLPAIGGMDGGRFLVIFAGGLIGVIIMRFAANLFVQLLQKRPSLESAAFLIVAWVGVKLAVHTLAHPSVAIISEHFPHSALWKITFWAVLLLIALGGWFFSGRETKQQKEAIRVLKKAESE
ncbi:YkoY family integral membrane protein [Thermolongibacillus altinsuensis]|uniref:YkoY family integral membrane protein n=1 Tax=Thermolongibacillus altinsuensis TaxID=575256 RepID=A0A4R1QG48_9BACL|nr:TerC family protein [Thermolongibacillus altinsuensis]TCL49294.1 YkoY family integral membrane protein [Thermolongibacillus altinsuensis]GMB10110.1 putative membrane protein YkoY [Thermolongibacillus altinsuensis]